jgi:hypothetical protein
MVGGTILFVIVTLILFTVILLTQPSAGEQVATTGPGIFFWLFLAALLLLGGWFLPGDIHKWLKPALFLSAIILAAIVLYVTGVDRAGARFMNWFDNCVGNQDCGPRADEIPIIDDGGTVDVPVGGNVEFYAEGEVTLKNRVNYCLDISPQGVFDIDWNGNVRRVTIKSYSGKREYASVTSIPISDPRC